MPDQNATSQKTSTASKWLIGCGIGCGVVILLLILIGMGSYFFVKNIAQGFKETEEIMDTVTERYGKIKEFCPDPDGGIRQERLEAFLAVRNSMISVREMLERSMNILSDEDRESQFKEEPSPNTLTKIKTGFELVPQIAEFYRNRSQALLDAKMGMGEYYFIYVIAYYSWLGKSPADGPPFKIMDQDDEESGIVWRRRTETMEDRRDETLKIVHRQILPMLRNQLDKLTGSDVSPIIDKWRMALTNELEAMEYDRFRLPWQDGLPEILEVSLEPYRQRLEASYSALLNPLEVATD